MAKSVVKVNKGFSVSAGEQADENFYGREEEINQLLSNYIERPCEHIFIRGDRQYGKTALVAKSFNDHPNDQVIQVTINLGGHVGLQDAKNKLVQDFMEAQGELVDSMAKIYSFISSRMPKITAGSIDIEGFKLALEDKKIEGYESFFNTLLFLDKVSLRLERPMVVFLDEIQDLYNNNTEEYELIAKLFRAKIVMLRNTTLVVAGSEPTIINDMMTSESRRFLGNFLHIPIKKMDFKSFDCHLKNVCEDRKILTEPVISEYCYFLSGGIASNLSYLGSEIIQKSSESSSSALIRKGDILNMLLSRLSIYETEYTERKAKIEAIDPGLGIFLSIIAGSYDEESNKDRDRYDMITGKLLKLMCISENEGSYTYEDPFFAIFCLHPLIVARKRWAREMIAEGKFSIGNVVFPTEIDYVEAEVIERT